MSGTRCGSPNVDMRKTPPHRRCSYVRYWLSVRAVREIVQKVRTEFKRVDQSPQLRWQNHSLDGLALWLRSVSGEDEPFVVVRAVVDDSSFTRAS